MSDFSDTFSIETPNRPSKDGSVFFNSILDTLYPLLLIHSVDIYGTSTLGQRRQIVQYRRSSLTRNGNHTDDAVLPGNEDLFASYHVITTFSTKPDSSVINLWHNLATQMIVFLLQEFPDIVATDLDNREICPSLRDQWSKIQRFAASNAWIFISGEAGTGKTFLARLFHHLSRPAQPLVEINLNAIPESLLEIELYGHAAGAFTDGTETKPGKLSHAGNGTIVFENLESLSGHAQSVLCNILQHKTYYPIGSTQVQEISARILISSRVSLDMLRREQKISAELFYLINVLPFDLKPLRHRVEDIRFFSEAFLTKARDIWHSDYRLSNILEGELPLRHWPGNIHELFSFLEWRRVESTKAVLTDPREGISLATQKDLKQSINQYKKNLIHDIVTQCEGNQTQAARVLGIQRTYLSRLIKELSIPL